MTTHQNFQELSWRAVEEFETTFSFSSPDETRLKLIEEELLEWREAFSDFLKETADVLYTVAGADRVGMELDDELVGRLREFAFVAGRIDTLNPGIIAETFQRVHASNMSKLGDDGLSVRREDGKILKGPNYKPPYLMDLVPAGPIIEAKQAAGESDYYQGA